jgi:diacylglycerol diphosphate phosphatase / phosphatidate phosphatase
MTTAVDNSSRVVEIHQDEADQSDSHSLMTDPETLDHGQSLMTDPETLDHGQAEQRLVVPDCAGVKEVGLCLAFFLVSTVPAALYRTPRQRPMPIQRLENGEIVLNLTNNEAFDGETIPDLLLIFLAALLPLTVQLMLGKFVLRSVRDLMSTICVYPVAIALTNTVTYVIKLYCGYLRPSFFQLCQPNNDMSECSVANDASARMSFPSGHASLSFCGLMLLSRFLQFRFGVVSSKRPNSRHRLMSMLALAPLGLATFIASSRVVDNRHFPADIVAGALLGGYLASFTHGIWFVEQRT